ncbi:hypothetical protein C8J56DRAFT_1040302 [Mycena floridula]|nr:hypothetical protein C8J56DRAFT_1040302 [Mycena floridula]
MSAQPGTAANLQAKMCPFWNYSIGRLSQDVNLYSKVDTAAKKHDERALCARHILRGPSSALRPTTGFSDASYCDANRGRVKMVMPGFVTYSSIQALFTISTVSSWDRIADDAYHFRFGSAAIDEPEEPKTDDEDVDDMILAQRRKDSAQPERKLRQPLLLVPTPLH